MRKPNRTKCEICGKTFPEGQLISGHGIRHEIERLIIKDHPTWNDNDLICQDDFTIYRVKYISSLIEDEQGSVETLKDEVIKSILQNDLLSADTNVAAEPLNLEKGYRIKLQHLEGVGSL